jgi:hypothetical protein
VRNCRLVHALWVVLVVLGWGLARYASLVYHCCISAGWLSHYSGQVGRLGNRGSICGRNKEFPFRVGDLKYVWYRNFSLGTGEKFGKSVS